MTVYIASTEKNMGIIQEDLFIQGAYLKMGVDSKIKTLAQITEEARSDDIVFLKSIWGYHVHYEKFLEQINCLERKNIKLINDYKYIYWNTNKNEYLKAVHFLKIIPTKVLFFNKARSTRDIENMILSSTKDFRDERFVIKPTISASGYLTFIYNKKSNNVCLQELLEHKNLVFLAQPFRSEIDAGEISLVIINGKIKYGVKRFAGVFTEKQDAEFIDISTIEEGLLFRIKLLLDYFTKKFAFLPKICRVDFVKNRRDYELMEIELIDPDLFFRILPKRLLNECLSELTTN
jgi:hypothetical protein